MRKLSSLVMLSLTAGVAISQGVTVPRTPSPAASVSQTIGISTINVKYSRPSVNGREVWGALVPYGWNVQAFGTGNSAPWRAGANENTVIHFSDPVKFEGQDVPAGDYGLLFVINKDNTGEVILSEESRAWGSFFYDKSQDQLRANIQVRDAPLTERLTYDFTNLTKTSAELDLNWEKKQFPVKIEVAVDDIVLANAEKELRGPVGFNWNGPASAANYALTNKVAYDKAIKWANQAVNQNTSFNTLILKSNAEKAFGHTALADSARRAALDLANEAELNTYGYQVLGQKDYDEAINIFLLNTQKHPKSPNAFDSLGEAYAIKGDKKNAILNFKKSLSMNPPDGVKQNSEKYLRQLGAM